MHYTLDLQFGRVVISLDWKTDMKPITRDIVMTLTVKFLLLFVLWWVCIKDTRKPRLTTVEWLMGSRSQAFLPPNHSNNLR